jgi:hypothetical protein
MRKITIKAKTTTENIIIQSNKRGKNEIFSIEKPINFNIISVQASHTARIIKSIE